MTNASKNPTFFDGHKLSKMQKRFLFVAALAYMFEQVDAALFGFALPRMMENWGMSMERASFLNSLTFVGMFFGGIMSGWISDKIGRKWSLQLCILAFSLGSLGTAVAQANHMFILEITRFLTGYGVVGMAGVGMVYIAEMMPSEKRGKYQSLCVASGTVGVPIFMFLAKVVVPINAESWRILFWATSAGLLLLPLAHFWVKESPRWLVSKGRIQEAEQIVFECINEHQDFSQLEGAQGHTTKIGFMDALKIMFEKKNRKQTLVVLLLTWGVMTGNLFLANWMITLMGQVGVALALALTISFIGSLGTPIGDFLSAFVTEKGGRKLPIAVCCIILGVDLTISGFAVHNSIILTITMVLRGVLSAMATTMTWTYLAESFPTKIRNISSGLIFGSCRIFTAASMFIVPVAMTTLGFAGVLTINALMYFIPGVLVLFMGASTSQRTLEDIEQGVR